MGMKQLQWKVTCYRLTMTTAPIRCLELVPNPIYVVKNCNSANKKERLVESNPVKMIMTSVEGI